MVAATSLSHPFAGSDAVWFPGAVHRSFGRGFLSSPFNDMVFLIGAPLLAFGVFLPFSIFPVLLPVTFAIWTVGPWPWPELRASEPLMTAIVLVVSIMHFWYDGFIWSVRKGQVH